MRHWIDRYATDIVAVSAATMSAAWARDWRRDPRCRVIYTAIDPEPFRIPVDRTAIRRELGVPDGSLLVIHIGSQQEAKNHGRVIEIFGAIHRRRDNARLTLVGRPDPRIEPRLRMRAAELGVSDRLLMLGERNDVPRLLRAADVMVFPSLWEGLPGAVLEACAAGLPVVATDGSFMDEIAARFESVRCLSLAAPDGAWAEAADALVRERAARGAACLDRDPANRLFSVAQYAREWLEVWAPGRAAVT
jgi:glycosyltransferase involved in cell wall biosynthesis